MNLRELVLKNSSRIMSFKPKEVRKTTNGTFVNYDNGPIVEYDGNRIGTMFDILCSIKTHKPDRKTITDYLISKNVPAITGTYVVDNGTRSSVIPTKNVASSIAKILCDSYYATTQSDGLSKRVATSSKVIFTLRSTTNSYYAAAKLSGILDNLKPDKCLSDTKKLYRNYPSYKKGLLDAGNVNTFLIEDYLDKGIVPSFIDEKQLKFWRDKKTFKKLGSVSAEEFMKEKSNILKKIKY